MVITINALSAKSLKDASKQVDKYANELANKNRIFMQELLNAGIAVIYDNLNGAGDSDAPTLDYPQVHVDYGGGNMTATLRLKGEDVMFVEFGAGVYYNGNPGNSPHPMGAELGWTIGSYGYHNGLKEYWHYRNDEGKWRTSHGTEAMMPMYKADVEIRQKFASIAKKVFGS